jgi:hypothetical protein
MAGLFATSTAEDCCLSLGNFGQPYCYSVDTGSGSGGPPGNADSPGPFTATETWRSTVQTTNNGYNDTYHGQLVINVNHPIDSFTYLLSGSEICEGNTRPGWHDTASIADWQNINITDGASWDGDTIDCGTFVVAHLLEWLYSWTLVNQGANTITDAHQDSCDLSSDGCGSFYGSP